jgi:capsule polysaccharide export protein KpsC/LpsZ
VLKRPIHQRQLLIHETPSRYITKYNTLTTTNNCKTLVVIEVETESKASVNTGGIMRTSEMSVLLKALIDLSATPVYFRPSREPTNGLNPCSFTDKAD